MLLQLHYEWLDDCRKLNQTYNLSLAPEARVSGFSRVPGGAEEFFGNALSRFFLFT